MLNKQNIPNLLTYLRVLAAPAMLLVAAFLPQEKALIGWIFGLASATDFLDGYLARKWNVVSPLGTMLDPIADKLLVAIVLLYLLKYTPLPILLVGIILGREIFIAGLREFLALRQIALPVSSGGKWKTALQIIAIVLLMTAISYPTPYLIANGTLINVWGVGVVLLWAASILGIVSAASYMRSAIRSL